jgi:hypothetical protein
MLQGLPLEAFHGDEGLPILFTDVVDGTDVGVVESRGGFGFATKPTERLRVIGEIVGKKF